MYDFLGRSVVLGRLHTRWVSMALVFFCIGDRTGEEGILTLWEYHSREEQQQHHVISSSGLGKESSKG